MGNVYLAEDQALARKVAIKVLHSHITDAKYTEAVLQEARTLAKINHSNVVQVHSVIEQPTPAIVMEYVPGITLKKYQLETSLTLRQKVRLLYQIAQGLEAIHKHDIIHSDIKADNILLDTRDSENVIAKLSDFGIAKPVDKNNKTSDKIRGSLPWMSPEQLQNQTVTTASDLFSFGLLAFQLLADKHAFAGHTGLNLQDTPTESTASDIAQQIVNDKAMDAGHITPALPAELVILLNRLLHKTASQRPTAKQCCDQLQQIIRMLERQDVLGMETQTVEALPVQKRKKAFVIPALALALVALLSIGLYWFNNQPPETRYVAVLKPKITETEPLSSLQKNLVLTSIEDALQQLIISTPHLMLIPQAELDDTQGDIALIGKSTGADDIVSPELICNAQHCELVLSLYNQTPDNNGEEAKWHTTNRLQNPIYLESYQPIYQFAQTQLTNLYSNITEINAKSLVISEEDYAEYLEIYYQVYTEGQYTQTSLERLEALIKNNAYFYPVYSLYFELVLEAYVNNNNDQLISKALTVYKSVPSELKRSELYLVDGFALALEQEQYDVANNILSELHISQLPKGKLHLLRANYFQKTKSFEDAVFEYQKAIKIRPTAIAYYHLAVNYWWMGNQKLVLESLENARALNRNLNSVNTLLAGIYLQQGLLDEAIKIYKTMSDISPSGATFTNLAIVSMLKKEYANALEFAELALNYDEEHIGYLINYADALLLSGKKERSLVVYNKVIKVTENKNDMANLIARAQALMHLDKLNEAHKTINYAKQHAPTHPNMLFTFAMISTKLNESKSALLHVEEAINQGIGKIWFYIPWFDELCHFTEFEKLTSINDRIQLSRCDH